MENYSSRDIAKREVFQYIGSYYNRVRRHSGIGSIAPRVFEKSRMSESTKTGQD